MRLNNLTLDLSLNIVREKVFVKEYLLPIVKRSLQFTIVKNRVQALFDRTQKGRRVAFFILKGSFSFPTNHSIVVSSEVKNSLKSFLLLISFKLKLLDIVILLQKKYKTLLILIIIFSKSLT